MGSKESDLFAAKCSTKTHYGSQSVCMSDRPSLLVLCHLLKKSSGNPCLKICDLMQFFFASTKYFLDVIIFFYGTPWGPYEQNENFTGVFIIPFAKNRNEIVKIQLDFPLSKLEENGQ